MSKSIIDLYTALAAQRRAETAAVNGGRINYVDPESYTIDKSNSARPVKCVPIPGDPAIEAALASRAIPVDGETWIVEVLDVTTGTVTTCEARGNSRQSFGAVNLAKYADLGDNPGVPATGRYRVVGMGAPSWREPGTFTVARMTADQMNQRFA